MVIGIAISISVLAARRLCPSTHNGEPQLWEETHVLLPACQGPKNDVPEYSVGAWVILRQGRINRQPAMLSGFLACQRLRLLLSKPSSGRSPRARSLESRGTRRIYHTNTITGKGVRHAAAYDWQGTWPQTRNYSRFAHDHPLKQIAAHLQARPWSSSSSSSSPSSLPP
ncbi:hypothetical protein LX36DRAFT_75589 [Colletotrichum falcatum]|nr:hypothetical protein LX36DRAFT_75589 [Colletotrichum falcatum]